MTYEEIKAKAIKDLHEARTVLDTVDTAADELTLNGAVLPPPFGMVLKIADAVRKVVDVLDSGFQQADAPAYDPTKSQGAGS